MSRWARFFSRRERMMEDLDQDIRDFIESETQDNIGRGMPPEEARYAALRKFGNVTRVKEDTWEVWSFVRLEQFWQDVRYGVRQLRRSPGFTAVAVVTLALGIGANTAMFTVIDSVLLRPLPFRDADRLVSIRLMAGPNESDVDWATYRQIRTRSQLLEDVAGVSYGDLTVIGTPQGGQKVRRMTITANALDMLGVHLALGRPFDSADYESGAAPVVLLGAELWRERFGSDPRILGRQVRLGGVPHTVVGTMPDSFHFWEDDPETASPVWVPAREEEQGKMGLAGRLKSGVTPQAVQAEVAVIEADSIRKCPQCEFVVKPYLETMTASVRPALLLLNGAILLVLTIACVNVANLQLARHLARRQEFAVRSALGGGTSRLLRQVMAEGAVLAIAGALAGLGIASILLLVVHRLPPNFIPRADEIQLRAPVFAMLAVFAAVTTILSSLAPALLATRTPPEEVLREGSGGSTAGKKRAQWSEWMVAGEVALSAILLVSTGLMFHTLYNLEHIHFGFDLDRVTTFVATPANAPGMSSLGANAAHKLGTHPPTESIVSRVYQPVADRLRQLPGVVDVGFSAWVPFDHNTMWVNYWAPKHPEIGPRGILSQICFVSPEYARAVGTPLIEGRMIADSDTAGSDWVAVVNQAFASRAFPGESPIGQQIVDPMKQTYTIIGVLGDARQHDLTHIPDPEVLFDYQQVPTTGVLYPAIVASGTNYIIRTRGDAELTNTIRQVFRQSAPDFAVDHFRTLRGALDEVTLNQRMSLYLTGIFAAVAILMVLTGLYGVLSQLVGQRLREIGIRLALGASPGSIKYMILRRASSLILVGLVVGLPAALAAGRLLRAFLYGVKPTDVSTFVFVAFTLLGLGIGAALLPARQATRVDPMVALRHE